MIYWPLSNVVCSIINNIVFNQLTLFRKQTLNSAKLTKITQPYNKIVQACAQG